MEVLSSHLHELFHPKKAPHGKESGPIFKTALFQPPAVIEIPTNGIMILLTNDFTRSVLAVPIIKAIARPVILYSLIKAKNSFHISLKNDIIYKQNITYV